MTLSEQDRERVRATMRDEYARQCRLIDSVELTDEEWEDVQALTDPGLPPPSIDDIANTVRLIAAQVAARHVTAALDEAAQALDRRASEWRAEYDATNYQTDYGRWDAYNDAAVLVVMAANLRRPKPNPT